MILPDITECCVAGRDDGWTGCILKLEILPGTMVANKRSGDLEPLLDPGVVLGGDLGECTATEGVSCGVERKSMDIGRLCPRLCGVTDPGRGLAGLRGVTGLSPLLIPEELHGECGLGRSSDTLPISRVCAVSWWRNLD